MNIQGFSKLEKFLRHRDFILSVAIISVLWLTPNTYFVYYSFMDKFASGWRELASAGVSLIVASGILIYTLRNNIKIANYYMWFEISISSYYYITTIGWDWGLIPAFSFVFMLPVSLKHYTIELNKDEETNNDQESDSKQGKIDEQQEIINEQQEIIDNLAVINERHLSQLQSVKEEKINYDNAILHLTKLKSKKEVNIKDVSEAELMKIADRNTILPDHML